MKYARSLTALIAIVVMSPVATTITATETVSPGAIDRMAQVNNACPTFSWGAEIQAFAYELVAYRMPEGEARELGSEDEALFASVTGSATSWTPSADQCFASGGRYVWFVRSVTEMIDDQVIEAGEWSAGRYFEVPAGPTPDELARALDVLKRWEATNGGGSPALFAGAGSATVPVPAAAAASGSGTGTGSGSAGHPKSVPTASAAVRGENPETDLEAYGVVGSSASVWGAGVAAVNTEGGADLVLDGSIDGTPDTRLSEWGIDRSDPTDQVFAMTNSGGGAITLDVFGTLRGTDLQCPSCVSSSDLAEESVTSTSIEDGGIGEMDIGLGAVNTTHIADGAVQAQDLAVDAVGGGVILDGSVTEADLADAAVTRNKLAGAAVTADKIAAGAVGASQIAFESIGESELADEAVTNPKIAPGAVDSSSLAGGSVTAAKLSAGAVTSSAIRNNAVTGTHIADEAVGSAEIEDGGVASSDIDSGAVGTAQLADGSVTVTKLAVGAIGSASIEDGAVTAAKLADGSVESVKLGPGAVTNAKLGDAAVSNEKLAMNAVTASRILDGSIVGADLADGAVGSSKLASNAVTGAHIVDGAVAGAELADWSVGSTKLAANAVSGVHIVDGSVSAADVEDGSLTAGDLNPGTGIYSSGATVFGVFVQDTAEPGVSTEVSTSCPKASDLPLQGFCRSASPDVIAYGRSADDWSFNDSEPASFTCTFYNDGATPEIAIAEIICVVVN